MIFLINPLLDQYLNVFCVNIQEKLFVLSCFFFQKNWRMSKILMWTILCFILSDSCCLDLFSLIGLAEIRLWCGRQFSTKTSCYFQFIDDIYFFKSWNDLTFPGCPLPPVMSGRDRLWKLCDPERERMNE